MGYLEGDGLGGTHRKLLLATTNAIAVPTDNGGGN
jgi:hypothetical protein